MIRYQKGSEPSCLRELRGRSCSWGDAGNAERKEMRKALIRDQGALCAYCQRRISLPERDLRVSEGECAAPPDESTDMRIEHRVARNQRDGDEGGHFIWNNLLGCCHGLAGPVRFVDLLPSERATTPAHTYSDRWETCCDRARGNVELWLHPVEGAGGDPILNLRYSGDGRVISNDVRALADINTLNLNATVLRRSRAAVLDAIRREVQKQGSGRSILFEIKKRYELIPGERSPEYSTFVLYHVIRWIDRS